MTVSTSSSFDFFDVLVIGGGAAGYFSAISVKERLPHASVGILEAGIKPLRKVRISGGGRCNVTHHMFDPAVLIKSYPRGTRELRGPMSRFGPAQMVDWLKSKGVELKVEADGRMFPVNDKSQTIIDCFLNLCDRYDVKQMMAAKVSALEKQGELYTVTLKSGSSLKAKIVILSTGSDRSGYQLAQSLGHQISDTLPSLFTFKIRHPLIDGMPGQSVTPVSLSLHFPNEKKVFRQDGPLLITHWGLSGPAVLKLSAFAAPELFHHDYKAKLLINFLPEHNEESLYQQYMLLKKENPERSLNATKPSSMSRRFWARFIETVDLDQNSPMQDLSKGKLRRFCKSMCAYELFVEGKGIFKEEFVTCGGVPRHEIDYRSMESKINPGLFIVGEITDVDGITGGFNFQNAWTGGWLAANKISEILPDQV